MAAPFGRRRALSEPGEASRSQADRPRSIRSKPAATPPLRPSARDWKYDLFPGTAPTVARALRPTSLTSILLLRQEPPTQRRDLRETDRRARSPRTPEPQRSPPRSAASATVETPRAGTKTYRDRQSGNRGTSEIDAKCRI